MRNIAVTFEIFRPFPIDAARFTLRMLVRLNILFEPGDNVASSITCSPRLISIAKYVTKRQLAAHLQFELHLCIFDAPSSEMRSREILGRTLRAHPLSVYLSTVRLHQESRSTKSVQQE